MDKSWMQLKDKLDPAYIRGIHEFINVATDHVDLLGRVRCPCKDCNNFYFKSLQLVKQDLFRHGIDESYTRWIYQGFLRNDVSSALSELSCFFKELCSKTLERSVVEKLQKEIALILCKLEMIYPPSFFVIMVHLTIHLPREVELGGPVQYRWMYPIERFLKKLKDFVRNKARPEGSIAEAYIAKECLDFCSLYLQDVETKFNRLERNYDGGQNDANDGFDVFRQIARAVGGASYGVLLDTDFQKVQWYILNNCNEIDDCLSSHMEEVRQFNSVNVQKRHEEQFAAWFKKNVIRLCKSGLVGSKDDLFILGLGPDVRVARYSCIIVNGIRFQIVDRDHNRRTQNSGVVVKGEHNSEEIDFYGVLKEIIELQYNHGRRVYLFKCDWWDVSDRKNGIKKDGSLVSVNTGRKWYENDPYVLADQVEQVFYVDDIKNGGNWRIVQRLCPRNLYNVSEINDEEGDEEVHEPYQQHESNEVNVIEQFNNEVVEPLHRDDILPDEIDANLVNRKEVSFEMADLSSEDETMMDDYDDDNEIDAQEIHNIDDEIESEEDADL